MRILYQFPTWLQRCYPNVLWRKDSTRKIVYLTFDDGPIEGVTTEILAILRRYDVKATFFCVGDNIRKHPDIFELILSEGHSVGNHTYHHLPGWQTPAKAYIDDVRSTDELMSNYGVSPRLFRPPYGRMSLSQKHQIAATHKIVLWDVLTHDYNPRYTPQKILGIVRRYTRAGSVINFHDSVKSEKNVISALPECIKWLMSEGYSFDKL